MNLTLNSENTKAGYNFAVVGHSFQLQDCLTTTLISEIGRDAPGTVLLCMRRFRSIVYPWMMLLNLRSLARSGMQSRMDMKFIVRSNGIQAGITTPIDDSGSGASDTKKFIVGT
jgi:hypothetical protein